MGDPSNPRNYFGPGGADVELIESFPYTVELHDNLSAIAKRYDIRSWQEIYNLPENAELRRRRPNPNLIRPGDVVLVPCRITSITRHIPLVWQRGDNSCWFAAGTMVLGYPPSATFEMWVDPEMAKEQPPKNRQAAKSFGGGLLADDAVVEKFMKQNGLILYPLSEWSLTGIANRLRTRSALFFPDGAHAVVVAGIEIDERHPNSSTLIIYDPLPVGHGEIRDEVWGEFIRSRQNMRASFLKYVAPESVEAEAWKKRGWFGTGTYFLHR